MKRTAVAVAFAAAFLFGAGTAQAAPCDGTDSTPVFAPWGDSALYSPVDNGGFESGGSGWTLTGKAAVVSGGNPHLTGLAGAGLRLPFGSSATSPPICVTHGNPTSRMFAETVVRNPKIDATLQVDVIYSDATRGDNAIKGLGKLPSQTAMGPTRKFSLAQGQLSIKPDSGGRTWIQYRFTPLEMTTWVIDDLFVDPRMRG